MGLARSRAASGEPRLLGAGMGSHAPSGSWCTYCLNTWSAERDSPADVRRGVLYTELSGKVSLGRHLT